VAKRGKGQQPAAKPAVNLNKVRVDKVKVEKGKGDKAKGDKVKVEKVTIGSLGGDSVRVGDEKVKIDCLGGDSVKVDEKCLGCSAERTERIKRTGALLSVAGGILSVIAGLLLFGRVLVEARKQPPPVAPIQIFQCAPVINVTVPAPKDSRRKR
jgi:hypothetical protein